MTEAQKKLVEENLRLVGSIARKYTGTSYVLDMDDLFQVGCEGLIHAATHYEEGKGSNFATYAYGCIDGYIKRELDDFGKTVTIPQYLALLFNEWKKTEQTTSFLEYAEEKGHRKKQAIQAYYATLPVVYLDKVVQASDEGMDTFLDFVQDSSSLSNTEELVLYKDMNERIADILNHYDKYNLKAQEVDVLKKRFGFETERMGLKEIAAQYNVSGEYIRQVEKKTLKKIKNQMAEDLVDYLEACNEYEFSSYA